jgi:hypothetical protein
VITVSVLPCLKEIQDLDSLLSSLFSLLSSLHFSSALPALPYPSALALRPSFNISSNISVFQAQMISGYIFFDILANLDLRLGFQFFNFSINFINIIFNYRNYYYQQHNTPNTTHSTASAPAQSRAEVGKQIVTIRWLIIDFRFDLVTFPRLACRATHDMMILNDTK